MPIRFLDNLTAITTRKGSLLLVIPFAGLQKGILPQILAQSMLDPFREFLRTLKSPTKPLSVTSMTGGDTPHKITVVILPDRVAKDNSPTQREWVYQQLEVIESDDHATVVLCLDKLSTYRALVTAVARRVRSINYKKDSKTKSVSICAVDFQGQLFPADEELKLLTEQTRWACRLVDTAPNHLNPSTFAHEIRQAFRGMTHVTIKEIVGEALERDGLRGIYAVGQAAIDEPRMVLLEYKPKASKKTIVLAGKGVCYDTGGLSLKAGSNMVGMKGDMAGAAAILAAFHILVKNQCPYKIIACVGLVENAIGPNAFRNDDVIVMHSGKSVEINNTDAEGRLILADCLSYCARKYKPQLLIDAATLTGAQLVATGLLHAAVISNREELDSLAVKIGKETGDLVTPLPFAPELFQTEFKSQVADMVNSVKNRSNAQTSCAAQFIYSHIDDLNIPWLHIDLAGPAHTLSGLGTGYGIQLISRIAREFP